MYCLGALSSWAKYVAGEEGSCREEDVLAMRPDRCVAMMYFSKAEGRRLFLAKAKELLPAHMWAIEEERDDPISRGGSQAGE